MDKRDLYEAVALVIPGTDIQKAFDAHAKTRDVIHFEGYEADGKPFFNIVFRKQRPGRFVARHGLTGAKYQEFFDKQVAAGRCLQSLDVYRSGNQTRYVAVFKSHRCKNQRAYHGVDAATHEARFKDFTADGFDPVNVSTAIVKGRPVIAAFYQKRPGGTVLRPGLTADQFGQFNRREHGKGGRKLVYLNAYTTEQGALRFNAIWRKAKDAKVSVGGQDTQQLIEVADEAKQRGLYTRYVTGWGVGGNHEFSLALYQP